MNGELIPEVTAIGPLTPRQRLDAAITVAEHYSADKAMVADLLLMLGLAKVQDGELIGTVDRDGACWFEPQPA